MLYFSEKEQSFFDDKIHENIPSDVVEIDDIKHQELLAALNKGCVVKSDLTVSPPQPSPYHVWSGKEWVLDKTKRVKQLADKKVVKLTEINNKAQDFINKAVRLNEVPDFEVQTWQQQRDEALAWQADKTAATPMLSAIATSRGIDINKLRQAALRKAIAFSQLTATIAGQRQAYVDQLNAAQSIEEIEAIEVAYQVGAA